MVMQIDIKIGRPFGSLAVLFPSRRREIPALRKTVVAQNARILEEEMKNALRRGGATGAPFAPLSPLTIMTRTNKINRPLYDKGLFLESITTEFSFDGKKAVVGISAFSRTARLISVAELVELHERGVRPFQLAVTPAIQAFFRSMNRKTQGRFPVITKDVIEHPGIPARPFIEPSLRAAEPRMRRETDEIFRELMLFKVNQDKLGVFFADR